MPLVLVTASGISSTKAMKPTVMNGRLTHVRPHLGHVEEMVEPEEGQ